MHNFLFEIQSVSWVPETICRQLLWKTSSKISSVRSTQGSEPYVTSVIAVAFNILILVVISIMHYYTISLNPLSQRPRVKENLSQTKITEILVASKDCNKQISVQMGINPCKEKKIVMAVDFSLP